MLHDESTVGETFELYGPKNYSTAEISELVDREIFKHRRHINLPKVVLKPMAHYLNKLLWWDLGMSGDEVEREYIDQKIDPAAKTFKDLGVEPAELSNLTFHYLVSGTVDWQRAFAYSFAERIPKQFLLRPAAGDGAREEGREAVCACY